MQFEATSAMWVRWAVWSLAGLAVFLAVIGIGGYSPAFLLGWAFGAVVWASLILFRRPHLDDPRPGSIGRHARS